MTLHIAVGTRACCITVVVAVAVVAAAHLKCPTPAKNAWGPFPFCENHVKMHGGNFVSWGGISWGRFLLGKNYMGAISALK